MPSTLENQSSSDSEFLPETVKFESNGQAQSSKRRRGASEATQPAKEEKASDAKSKKPRAAPRSFTAAEDLIILRAMYNEMTANQWKKVASDLKDRDGKGVKQRADNMIKQKEKEVKVT